MKRAIANSNNGEFRSSLYLKSKRIKSSTGAFPIAAHSPMLFSKFGSIGVTSIGTD
jgi:hypothetical protein